MAQIVRGLASILEYEGMARVHLIGISLGGMEAQCFVRAYPRLVQSLILCQTGVPTRLFASPLGTGARLLSLLPPRLLRAAAKQAILHSFPTSDPERGFWNTYLDNLFTFPVGRAKERMVSACRKISDLGT
jgi:pimeloyl-ACP methyl ester carboxylesterase